MKKTILLLALCAISLYAQTATINGVPDQRLTIIDQPA